MKELLFNSFASTVYKVLSAVLKFGQILFITNLYGAESFGAYTFAMSVFLFVNSIFRFGFDVYIHKEVASIFIEKGRSKSQQFFVKVVVIPIVVLTFISIIIKISLMAFGEIAIRLDFLSSLILYSSLYAFMWLFAYYNRGIEKGKTSVFILEIVFPIINILGLLLFSYLELNINVILIHSYGLAIVVCLTIFYGLEKLDYTLFGRLLSKIKNYSLIETKNAFPFLLISMSSMLLAWVDFYVISFFESDSNLGIYSASTKLAQFMLFPASAIAIFFSNKLVEFYKDNNHKSVVVFLKKITIILFIVSSLLFIFINLFSSTILNLFGSEFKEGNIVLLILTFAYLINSSFGSFETVLLMSSYKKYLFNMNLITVLLNIILNIPLVFLYGIEGAAFGTLITIATNRIMQYFFIKNKVLKNING